MNKKEKEQDTRNRLMAATEEVFSRRGYTLATLDEIITLADTGKGTLYKYFGNKADLFYTLVSQKHAVLMKRMWAIANKTDESIEERLTGILTVWIGFLRKNRVLWQVLCFEMTCSSRGYFAEKAENGDLILATGWGNLPEAEERENILRYHRLLAEEMEPITQVYAEGIQKGFFKESASHEGIARNIILASAMLVFFQTANNLEDVTTEELATGIVRNRLYGLAEKAADAL